MSRLIGILLGACALPPCLAVGITVAAAVNLHYDPHPVFLAGALVALALTVALGRASLRAFGVGSRAALLAPLVVALAWTGGYFLLAWSRYPDRGAAVRANRAVLQALPAYPGVTFRTESTSGEYEGDLAEEGFISPPSTFTTTWAWSAPTDTSTRTAADWYEARLGAAGWSVRRDDVGEGSIFLVAARGDSTIEVDVRPQHEESDPHKIPVDGSTTPAGEIDATAGL